MTWDNSPWAIEGAETSADVGRRLAYKAVDGYTGVSAPGDLKVLATSVPGSQVRVSPGGATIPNRASGRSGQVYDAYNPTDDLLTIPATGSNPRSDLIVARVENPITGEPWQEPDDPVHGQYVFTRRYPDVGNTVTDVAQVDPSASAITLARVDIPANTGTFTQEMVRDLRLGGGLANNVAQNKTVLFVENQGDNYKQPLMPSGYASWYPWPLLTLFGFNIPPWAVGMDIDAAVVNAHLLPSVYGKGGFMKGACRLKVSPDGSNTGAFYTPASDFSLNYDTGPDRYSNGLPQNQYIPLVGSVNIPASRRGTRMFLIPEFYVYDLTVSTDYWGKLTSESGTILKALINFRAGQPYQY